MKDEYLLIDSGRGRKLEQVGAFRLIRPSSQAVWNPLCSKEEWEKADAIFSRDGGNCWSFSHKLPSFWKVRCSGVDFKISPTDFGHLGIFPEHKVLWEKMQEKVKGAKSVPKVLNLFAYSGGATLALAKAGAELCHLDASKAAVTWARENAALNRLEKAPIRWIVDDALKFLKREEKRKVFYEGILLDPPSFGRGAKEEVFKIERDILPLLEHAEHLLSEKALFFLFSSHTPGFTPMVMENLLRQALKGRKGKIQSGELFLSSLTSFSLPSGSFAFWEG